MTLRVADLFEVPGRGCVVIPSGVVGLTGRLTATVTGADGVVRTYPAREGRIGKTESYLLDGARLDDLEPGAGIAFAAA